MHLINAKKSKLSIKDFKVIFVCDSYTLVVITYVNLHNSIYEYM